MCACARARARVVCVRSVQAESLKNDDLFKPQPPPPDAERFRCLRALGLIKNPGSEEVSKSLSAGDVIVATWVSLLRKGTSLTHDRAARASTAATTKYFASSIS